MKAQPEGRASPTSGRKCTDRRQDRDQTRQLSGRKTCPARCDPTPPGGQARIGGLTPQDPSSPLTAMSDPLLSPPLQLQTHPPPALSSQSLRPSLALLRPPLSTHHPKAQPQLPAPSPLTETSEGHLGGPVLPLALLLPAGPHPCALSPCGKCQLAPCPPQPQPEGHAGHGSSSLFPGLQLITTCNSPACLSPPTPECWLGPWPAPQCQPPWASLSPSERGHC